MSSVPPAHGPDTMKPCWVLATNNEHKLREFREMLAEHVNILSLSDIGCSVNPEESGHTFEENALIKAREVARHTQWPVLSDDSGLEVDALGGAPGVKSARYAGPEASDRDNLLLLLRNLEKENDRSASFVACLCLLRPDKHPVFFTGRCPGHITASPSGEAGFGYDPVFVPDGFDRTFAEMSPDSKNSVSHRAHALSMLLNNMTELLVD